MIDTTTFEDPATGETVQVEVEGVGVSELDGHAYFFKMFGPDDRCYTYETIISITVLATSTEAGGFSEDLDAALEDAYAKVRKLVAEGRYEDLILGRSSVGWSTPQPVAEPLEKHSACTQAG